MLADARFADCALAMLADATLTEAMLADAMLVVYCVAMLANCMLAVQKFATKQIKAFCISKLNLQVPTLRAHSAGAQHFVEASAFWCAAYGAMTAPFPAIKLSMSRITLAGMSASGTSRSLSS